MSRNDLISVQVLSLFILSYILIYINLFSPILSHIVYFLLYLKVCDHTVISFIHFLLIFAHGFLHQFYSNQPTTLTFLLTPDEYFHLCYIPFLALTMNDMPNWLRLVIVSSNVTLNALVILTKSIVSFYMTFGLGSLYLWTVLWVKDGMGLNVLNLISLIIHGLFTLFVATNEMSPSIYVAIATCSFYSECVSYNLSIKVISLLDEKIQSFIIDKKQFLPLVVTIIVTLSFIVLSLGP
jgi:hypothetical protein